MTFFLQTHPGVRFHTEYNVSYNHFDLWLAKTRNDMGGKWDLVSKVEMTLETDHTPGAPTPPAMTLSIAEGQALLDSLWGAGLRPRDWGKAPTDVAGVKDEVIAAQKEHISDLRGVVVYYKEL